MDTKRRSILAAGLVVLAISQAPKVSAVVARLKSKCDEAPAVTTTVMNQLPEPAGRYGSEGLTTGFRDFDEKIQGLTAGDLMILAARPSMGKTSLALNIAEHVAFDRREAVAVLSMELPTKWVVHRLVASRGGIPLQKLREGSLEDDQKGSLATAVGEIKSARLIIDDTDGLSPNELRAKALRLKRQADIRLLIIDYIQLMHIPVPPDHRADEISEISRNLKSLAKELGIPIIALSQLNRGVERRSDRRPKLSDFWPYRGIDQYADLVVFVYRDCIYNKGADEREAEIIIAKQRNSPPATVRMRFSSQFTRFEDSVSTWQPLPNLS